MIEMLKKIALILLAVMLSAVILTSCSQKKEEFVDVSTSLQFDNAFAGSRTVTMTFPESTTGSGTESSLDKVVQKYCPETMEYSKDMSDGKIKYSFVLKFNSAHDYSQKVEKITGIPVNIAFSNPDTILTQGWKLQEDFSKKNFWGIHELRNTHEDAKAPYVIQFLPRITSASNFSLPQPVMELCKQWSTYKILESAERNALRNLLYVGMTRARDYLTTLSKQGGQNALPTLSWVANTGISVGNISNNAANLWGDGGWEPIYEDLPPVDEDQSGEATEYTRYKYPDLAVPCNEPKYLSPSKLPQMEFSKDNIEILKDLKCRIESYDPEEDTEAAAGTCIHNIFAVYDPNLSHEEKVEVATNIRNGNNMYEVISKPEEVINSIEHLYTWLEGTYGKASSIKHEVPFIQPLPGQVVHGEIDLLWMLNDHECVLIDFKNFPGDKATITNPNPKNEHYAGLYASQLKAYREVLQTSGLTVRDTLIYYSVMGCVVRLNM